MDSHHLITTFATATALGVFFLVLAQRLKVSAIVVLLIGGILAGPQVLDIVHPKDLGHGLNALISLAVGLILFEGGLTLDVKGFRQVSKEIWGVLTWGIAVTWMASTLLIKLVFDFDWPFCLFAASLIIVTGPTVIGPLLQRIGVKKNIHHILHWEGVLIDPIGVFIALLCYEWFVSVYLHDSAQGGALGTYLIQLFGSSADSISIFNFALRFIVGMVLGLSLGGALYQVLKREWVPEEYLNIFVLATAMIIFSLSDILVTESGLLAVTVAGLLVGYKDTPQLDRIIEYKVELKDLLISLLFVLLAANLELSKFLSYGWKLLIVVVAVMVVVRPLNIFISTYKSSLTLREKLFLSWIAPRGIVAASMASICAFHLTNLNFKEAGFLETFTYSVIAGTVIFQGFTAKLVGRALGVLEPKPKGWVIVGAHKLARLIAHFIQESGCSVVLIDTNPREVKLARREGLIAINENAMQIDPEHNPNLYGIGNFVAFTENEDLNRLLCQRWEDLLKKASIYRWVSEQADTSVVNARLLVGRVVWQNLQLRAALAQEEREELKVRRISTNIQSYKDADNVLMCLHNGELYPYVPADAEGQGLILSLAPVSGGLEIPSNRKWTLFSEAESLEGLYSDMLQILVKEYPKLDHDRLLRELVQREEEFSSLLGHGISLPHTYSKNIDATLVVIARVKDPISCKHSGSDISLVFMLLSPEEQPVEHLNQISQIAKFVMREETRVALLEAQNDKELLNVIMHG